MATTASKRTPDELHAELRERLMRLPAELATRVFSLRHDPKRVRELLDQEICRVYLEVYGVDVVRRLDAMNADAMRHLVQ
jgi:hypothetical protein